MKFNTETVIVASYFLLSVSASIVQTDSELICSPTDPSDCYPKVFVPTNYWQTIKEGQEIPAGLHVRLNLETSTREAKISEEDDSNANTQDLVITEEPEIVEETMEEQIQRKIREAKENNSVKKPRASPEELNNYEAAVTEIHDSPLGSNLDLDRISIALDTLIELSHDIEFGAKLTSDQRIFQDLLRIGTKVTNSLKMVDIQEKAYRIMGSALRNNPEAVDNVLNKQSSTFLDTLFAQLRSIQSDVLQKRILGVIHALTQSDHFNAEYINGGGIGLDKLVDTFPSLGQQSKTRLINILEDANLLNIDRSSNSKRVIEDSTSPEKLYSDFLQDRLLSGKTNSETQLRLFFNKLSEVHTNNKNLKANKEFISWLAAESDTRAKSGKNKERDSSYTSADQAFDRGMLEARHIVFGNPMGLRKAYADEL
ncbi:nucleotide exchange factor Sil1p [[Candida] anglica]